MAITYRGEKFAGYNKPKASAKGTKSHVVLIKDDGKDRMIRFGEKGASTAGKPKAGESEAMKAKRKSFKARHAKNIAKGKTSAAYWSNKVKWQGKKIKQRVYAMPKGKGTYGTKKGRPPKKPKKK